MATHLIIRPGVFFSMEGNVIPITISPLTLNPVRLFATLLPSFLSLHPLCGYRGKANPGLIREDSPDEAAEERETQRDAEGESERHQKNDRLAFAGSLKIIIEAAQTV